MTNVIDSEVLATCKTCNDETIKLTLWNKERGEHEVIYANHIEGCPDET